MEQSNKFRNGKIYKIECNISGLVYIGSTIKTLDQRLKGHEYNYKRYTTQESTKFLSSFTILDEQNYNISLIINYPCESRKELLDMEGKFIRKLDKDCVNKNMPGRTSAQYREDNKDFIKTQKRIYREDNKDAIKIQQRIYREDNKDAIKIQQRIYREDNKDAIKTKERIYREKNRKSINEKQFIKRWKKMFPDVDLGF
jgi:aspartate carbamoyltransferase regulatory subunit